jgi:chromosome segregation ATPase
MIAERPDDQTLGPEPFTPAQRAGLDARHADQDRTLDAIHQLEEALSAAAPRREDDWRRDVLRALDVLEQAATEEERNAALPESLLSDIARTQPRLRTRVRGLRVQYRQLRDAIAAVRHELEEPDAHVDVADVRQRLAWLLGAFRHQRARESDLIYEAYYEAFHRDLPDDARDLP